MPDLNEEALMLLNGPGPQHINENNKPEWSRGSDGAQHMKIVDSNGNPLSTIKTQDDNVENRLQAIENKLDSVIENGAVNSQLTGSKVLDVNVLNQPQTTTSSLQEQLTETDAISGVLTFSENIKEVEIYNTSSMEGTFNVNGIDLFIPADTIFQATVDGTPSSEVTVSNASTYIVGRYA